MSVQEIEKVIEELPVKDVHLLADWLAEHRQELQDKQLEEDEKAGRLDALINKAKEEYRQGMTRSL
jgi:hypothetical protein